MNTEIEIRDALIVHLSSGSVEDGIEFLKKNLEKLSEVFSLECLGNISFYKRDMAEAIKLFEAATILSPEHVIPRYLYLAGVKNEREKNFVDAFKYYQAAIEAEPTFVDSYVELGGLLSKVGDFEGALRCYEDAVRLDSEESSNHENLKTVLIKLSQNQSERYEKKLQAANIAYEDLLFNGKLNQTSPKHQW